MPGFIKTYPHTHHKHAKKERKKEKESISLKLVGLQASSIFQIRMWNYEFLYLKKIFCVFILSTLQTK